jgi:hypothetical protein
VEACGLDPRQGLLTPILVRPDGDRLCWWRAAPARSREAGRDHDRGYAPPARASIDWRVSIGAAHCCGNFLHHLRSSPSRLPPPSTCAAADANRGGLRIARKATAAIPIIPGRPRNKSRPPRRPAEIVLDPSPLARMPKAVCAPDRHVVRRKHRGVAGGRAALDLAFGTRRDTRSRARRADAVVCSPSAARAADVCCLRHHGSTTFSNRRRA